MGDEGTPAISLVVADGEDERRTRRCHALAADGFAIVAEAADAESAVAAVVREQPGLCLVDLDLPGGALAAIARLASRVPATVTVALAAVESPPEMIEAIERGASGYLRRSLGPAGLARTLRAAHAGEPAIPRALVPHLIGHMRNGPRRPLELEGRTVDLTPREWDVAGLVRAGLATDEVAERLGLSPVTVRRHISSLVRKTGVPGRAGLLDALDRLGL